MSCPFNKESLDKLKAFIDLCSKRPEIIHISELAFFKDYLVSMNATIPAPEPQPMDSSSEQMENKTEEPIEELDVDEESEPESLENDLEGCVAPDEVGPVNMGDPTKIPTEEDCDKADEKRIEAMSVISEGNYQKAVDLLTEAIILNPTSAVLFVKRGQASLQLKKPNACIKDCTHALELNPDSAPGYKFRGRAYRLIGSWELAAKDLRQACIIDFDEQADEWLKEVTPNALKVEQHKLKNQRKKSEKELKERQERVRKAQEAHAKAAQETSEESLGDEDAAGLGDFYKLLKDPEVMAAFKDPEVAAAFQDISTNPANFEKYQSNPKVMELIGRLSRKFQGSGVPGMGFPGMNFSRDAPRPAPGGEYKASDDDILD